MLTALFVAGFLDRAMAVVFALLTLALFLGLARLALGPTLPDRVIALDQIAMVVIGTIGAYCISTEQPVYLDTAIIIALLTFFSTVGFARYLEIRTFRKGDQTHA